MSHLPPTSPPQTPASPTPGRAPTSPGATQDALVHQYHTAVTLYMHEDNLNWLKVGRFLTLTFVLYAGFAYFWQEETDGVASLKEIVPICALGVLGIIVAWIFRTSLKSGLAYMLQRKQAAVDLEAKLVEQNPELIKIVGGLPGKSKTVNWLFMLPSIMLFVWAASIACLLTRVCGYYFI